MTFKFFHKNLTGPFTIPSGIVTTSPDIIQYFIDSTPDLGVITTKSIGLAPRVGYREPIYSQYAPGCYINAVGLTNPGAKASVEVLGQLRLPKDRFLLTSIFGGSIEEFVEVARLLAPVSDGLELNLSCPHAQGYGMSMGQDPELVRRITQAVKDAVDIPVIPKLTPNVPDIRVIAEAAAAGGADALCAINTLGPGEFTRAGNAVLSNGQGGLSGKGVLPIGLKCVHEIRQAVDCPIIACGGISTAEDVQSYALAGAQIFGVGSALTGLNSKGISIYFQTLAKDFENGTNLTERNFKPAVEMTFRPVTLVENHRVSEDISLLRFDRPVDIKAGEFIFLWIPGVGEKPFSVLTRDSMTLAVINLGQFTEQLIQAQPGTAMFFRGPYGVAVSPPRSSRIILVSGGTGLAAVYQIAQDFEDAEIFFGARSEDRLYFIEQCQTTCPTHIATDDGSVGYHGLVTELLEQRLQELNDAERAQLVFYNCGPEPMVHAADAVQRKFVPPERIYNGIDYLTKCGVGVCGACGAPDGRRLCVDGPFMSSRG